MFNYSPTTLYSIFCAAFPCIIYMIMCGRKQRKIHNIWVIIFTLYLWQVYDVTGIGTLSDILNRPEGSINPLIFQGTINLVPFTGLGYSFVLNILMCIPFGFLVPFIWVDYRRLHKTVVLGACFSLMIELSQLFNGRATDIDDLIANTCGVLLGYVVWKIFVRLFGERMKQSPNGKTEVIAYISISFLGMFFLYYPFWFVFDVLKL